MMRLPAVAILFLGVLFLLGCSHDAKNPKKVSARGDIAVPPGKLERIERQRYPAPAQEGSPAAADAAASPESGQDDLIRIEGQSSGTPGLVLTRAMSGAQALGYTLLSVDNRGFYFVAEKRSSLLGAVLSGVAGVCKIAVGATPDPGTRAVKINLKGRAQTVTGRPVCERDLRKLLEYARGDVVVKPKSPSTLHRPSDVYRHEP